MWPAAFLKTITAALRSAAVVVLLAAVVAPAGAVSEADLINNLSPQDRERLLNELGKSSGGSTTRSDDKLEEPELVKSRKTRRSEKGDPEGGESGDTGSEGDDGEATGDEEGAEHLADLPEKNREEEKPAMEPPEPFGYDLFEGVPTSFAPATDIPVPVEYIVGPGDNIKIHLFGKENQEYSLIVSRQGSISVPALGPVSVAGLKFEAMEKKLKDQISRQKIGVKASITMGELRSIRIFVLGDASTPGSYTVSSLSTMTNALFLSGGIKEIGSLRNIQLKRRGKVVNTLDLYDLLIRGDTSDDARLEPGDVIFIPPIGKTVAVAGEVRRPAIYELKKEKRVEELVKLAGGLLPTAYPQASQLEHIKPGGGRALVDVDLTTSAGKRAPISNGDLLRVYSVLERVDDVVLLTGHVERPGAYQWRKGMKVIDLLSSTDMLLPQADLDYILVKRMLEPDGEVELHSFRLQQVLKTPACRKNILLQPKDEIIVFDSSSDRAEILEPIIEQLRQQATINHPDRKSVV